jgi:hypothetical protein
MPVTVPAGRPTVCVRRAAFEAAGLTRSAIDQRFNLTPDEFTVEAALIVIGPLANEDLLPQLIEELEASGLTYFDDFFELSGNWPEWLRLYAMAAGR